MVTVTFRVPPAIDEAADMLARLVRGKNRSHVFRAAWRLLLQEYEEKGPQRIADLMVEPVVLADDTVPPMTAGAFAAHQAAPPQAEDGSELKASKMRYEARVSKEKSEAEERKRLIRQEAEGSPPAKKAKK